MHRNSRLHRPVGVLVCAAVLVASCGGNTAKPSATTPVPSIAVTPAPPAESPSPLTAGASTTAPSLNANPTPTPVRVKIEAGIPVPKPLGLAVLDNKVWVTTPSGAARIDPATNTLTAVKFGSGSDEIDAITAAGAAVWVSDYDASTVYRIDPKTMRVVAQIPVGLNPEEIYATADAVWVANHHAGTVSRIDSSSNLVVATIKIGPEGSSGPQWIAVGLGSVWVSVPSLNSVVRIDAVTNTIQATIAGADGGIAVSTDAVWVTKEHSVARIDPQSNQIVADVDIGGGAADPAVIGDAPWFAVVHDGSPGTVVRIDPATNRIDRVLTLLDELGSTPVELSDATLARAIAANSLWIGDASEPGRVLRVPLAALSGQ